MPRKGIALREGLAVWPGIVVQDGHDQLVMPLAIPVERLAHAALMAKVALLVNPLGPRVEVVDSEAHPMQAGGAQCEVEDEPGDLGSIALTEHVRPGEPDAIVG